MKRIAMIAVMVLLIASFTGMLSAANGPSTALGEKLFKSKTLGGASSGKSCATCHPRGQGLENATKRPDLTAKINNCIVGALRGHTIGENSIEMKSLVLYLKFLRAR
ncbi:MAG: hypothetical protein PHN75_04505 [Syntrophales bacterium]|nr:hypothetical protein [Syntrophales bacterium]